MPARSTRTFPAGTSVQWSMRTACFTTRSPSSRTSRGGAWRPIPTRSRRSGTPTTSRGSTRTCSKARRRGCPRTSTAASMTRTRTCARGLPRAHLNILQAPRARGNASKLRRWLARSHDRSRAMVGWYSRSRTASPRSIPARRAAPRVARFAAPRAMRTCPIGTCRG